MRLTEYFFLMAAVFLSHDLPSGLRHSIGVIYAVLACAVWGINLFRG